MNSFRRRNPYHFILYLAIFLRLIAVVFSEGYLLPVEHFFFFEPQTPLNNDEPFLTVQSPLYALFGQSFRQWMSWLALSEPGMQALILRLIHALFNIFSLVIGYRLALLAGSVRGARLSFALLALSWLMPFISVRTFSFNLALPFLLGAVWIARYSLFSMKRASFLAGLIAAVAIMLYPPVLVFWLPYVFITLFLGKPIRFFALVMGSIAGVEALSFLVSHSLLLQASDWVPLLRMTGLRLWQVNFYALRALFILGLVLGPPLGFFVIYGFVRLQKFTIRMSLPALFCLVGSIFSVDPLGLLVAAFPFLVITGSQSWMEIVENQLNPSRQLLYYVTIGYFWIFNTILLVWFSTVAPHKQELDAMRYIGRKPYYHSIWVEQTYRPDLEPLPKFYCGRQVVIEYMKKAEESPAIVDSANRMLETACVVFRGEEMLKQRLLNVYNLFPALSFEAIFRPGITEKYFRRFMGLPSGTLVIYHNEYLINNSLQ